MQELDQITQHYSRNLNSEEVLDTVVRVMTNSEEVFWEDTDCCKSVATVYKELYGYDLMSNVSYKGKEETNKLVDGNIFKIVIRTLYSQGFRPIKEELTGSIGLVKMVNGEVAVAICVSENNWAVRSEDGFCILQTRAIISLYNKEDNN